MPIIKITAADVKRGEILDEGWYGLLIKDVSDWVAPKPGKQGSNMTVTFLVDNSEGKEINYNINTAGIGFHIPLFSALAGKKLAAEDISIDTADWMGKRIDGKCKPDLYNGKLINNLVDFLPFGEGKNKTAPY